MPLLSFFRTFPHMKAFISILIAFIYYGLKPATTQTLNIQDFGAVGDGVTDATSAINSCLAAAHTAKKSVVFPAGVYLCNSISSGNILTFDAGGISNITIYGSNATIKTTSNSASTQLAISAFSTSSHLTIAGLNFLNTHGKISVVTSGIFLQGTSGQNLDTVLIRSCTFAGFNQHIGAQGVIGLEIANNHFNSPNGHDDGEQNRNPCANIFLYDNSNGYCQNVNIHENIGLGYSGPFPMTAPRPIDGFLYAVMYNGHVWGNVLKFYSEELIDVQPYGTHDVNTTLQNIVENNSLDCSIIPGSVDSAGGKHKVNYAIRMDANHSIARNNNIYNYTYGLMTYGPDFPSLTQSDFSYTNNTLFKATDTSVYTLNPGIFIVGNSNLITFLNASNNKFYQADSSQISLTNCTNPTNSNNYYSPASN